MLPDRPKAAEETNPALRHHSVREEMLFLPSSEMCSHGSLWCCLTPARSCPGAPCPRESLAVHGKTKHHLYC